MSPGGHEPHPETGGDTDPLSAVHAHLEAFNAGDVERVVATFREDALFVAGDQVVVGHRALRAMFADAFAAPVEAQLTLNHVVVSGATAACELTETLEVEGSTHSLDVAAFYTAQRGQLVRVKVYRDLSDPQ
ncbi:nuclear transport factor 2 family protein [Egibacter rhizosphaerae]|nr:nuclear transport factor 2 family protein [Egibacter rhizosphaerae]